MKLLETTIPASNVFSPLYYIRCFLFFFLLFCFSFSVSGQEDEAFEEISIALYVPHLGTTELTALISNEEAFLPVKDLFDFCKIKNESSNQPDSISGFLNNPKNSYVVDHVHGLIRYGDKPIRLSTSDVRVFEQALYLKSNVFGDVFGLHCHFNYRSLNVTLKPQVEIPAVREMQLEQLRRNLSQLRGEKKADTTLNKRFRFASFGMADWTVTNVQEINRAINTRVNVAIGGTLFGGQAEANFNMFSNQPITIQQQSFRWRYVNNKSPVFRQITAGRISPPTVASIFAPVHGFQVTNTPISSRKSFGTYRYTGTTQANWIVELYLNNALVEYVKADASGFYAFDIPVLYGNSSVRLKFLGPWGEENTKEETIHIPINFLPIGEFQYVVSSGVVANTQNSLFSRAEAQYGLSNRLTIGGGSEYLSSIGTGKVMPFLNSSARVGQKMIWNAEYMHNVRLRASINYRPDPNIHLDVVFIKYDPNQDAVWNKYLQERKVALTLPFRTKRFTAFSRFSYNQYISIKSRNSDADLLLSSVFGNVSFNMRTFAQLHNTSPTAIHSNVSLAFMAPGDVRLTPQVQYQYNGSRITLIKLEAERRISHRGFLNLNYEKNPGMGKGFINTGLRYNLSFAQTHLSMRTGRGVATTTQQAKGSLMFDGESGYIGLSHQSSVGKGGIIVSPFLDINCNGLKEQNEPKLERLNLRVSGGRVQNNVRDTTLLVLNLEPYAEYLIEMDLAGFDNIAWKLKYATMNVSVEPNQLRLLQIPIQVLGEASGMVYYHDDRKTKGVGRIIVGFYNTAGKRVAQVLTESDGFFSFMGLVPGNYVARLDPCQLHTLNLVATPENIEFHVKASEEGSVADHFEFIVKSAPSLRKGD